MSQVVQRCYTGHHPASAPRRVAHWGRQQLLALANSHHVLVLDTSPLQLVNTLVGHGSPVTTVKWHSEISGSAAFHSVDSSYRAWLASADLDGNIIVWDVRSGLQVSRFSDGGRPVEIFWLTSFQNATRDLLVAIHPMYNLIMWNAATGNKLWKKSYTFELLGLSLNPFVASSLLLLSSPCSVVHVGDFTISQSPGGEGSRLRIPGVTVDHEGTPGQETVAQTGGSSSSRSLLPFSNVIGGSSTANHGSRNCTSPQDELLQMEFLPSLRDHFILVYPYKIGIINLNLAIPVCWISLDPSTSPLVQVYACSQRNAFFCLHNNGNITFRVERPVYDEKNRKRSVPVYDVKLQSESVRVSKQNRVLALCVCPSTERVASVVVSDGRILTWSIHRILKKSLTEKPTEAPLISLIEDTEKTEGTSDVVETTMEPTGSNVGFDQKSLSNESVTKSIGDTPNSLRGIVAKENSVTYLSDLFLPTRLFMENSFVTENSREVSLRFTMTGLISGLGPAPFVLKMCPPLTTKNYLYYRPLLAVGCSNGNVCILDLKQGVIIREIAGNHSAPVSGIDWVSLNSYLSFSVANIGAGNSLNVRNELFFTDLNNGKSKALLNYRNTTLPSSISPLQFIKVSPGRNYFIAAYRSKPFEIWDLQNLTLLREVKLASSAPLTALEWSPIGRIGGKHRSADGHSDGVPRNEASSPTGAAKDPSASRENFVFTNSSGLLYHFTVEQGAVQDASKYPPEGGMQGVTTITWKGDVLAIGDSDGGVSLWDLKNKISRGINLNRQGSVRKLKFAPGKGNTFLLVLLGDGSMDIWDAKDNTFISSYRPTAARVLKIVDADWAASSEPAIAFSDGTVRVTNLDLEFAANPSVIHASVSTPYLMQPEHALTLKSCFLFSEKLLKRTEDGAMSLADESSNQNTKNVIEAYSQNLLEKHRIVLTEKKVATVDKCILISKLMSDAWDCHFWTLVQHCLARKPGLPLDNPGSLLDCNLEYLLENGVYRKNCLDREYTHSFLTESHPAVKDACASNLIRVGDLEEASIVLLATDPSAESFVSNGLKTCLITNVSHCAAPLDENMPKLVATNLIASGFLAQGVEILCLYGKHPEACRYLQSYGRWDEATHLAKCNLHGDAYVEIVKKWIQYLSSPQINLKNVAILVNLSIGHYMDACKMLLNTQQPEKALLLVKSMRESELIGQSDDSYNEIEDSAKQQLKLQLGMLEIENLVL